MSQIGSARIDETLFSSGKVALSIVLVRKFILFIFWILLRLTYSLGAIFKTIMQTKYLSKITSVLNRSCDSSAPHQVSSNTSQSNHLPIGNKRDMIKRSKLEPTNTTSLNLSYNPAKLYKPPHSARYHKEENTETKQHKDNESIISKRTCSELNKTSQVDSQKSFNMQKFFDRQKHYELHKEKIKQYRADKCRIEPHPIINEKSKKIAVRMGNFSTRMHSREQAKNKLKPIIDLKLYDSYNGDLEFSRSRERSPNKSLLSLLRKRLPLKRFKNSNVKMERTLQRATKQVARCNKLFVNQQRIKKEIEKGIESTSKSKLVPKFLH